VIPSPSAKPNSPGAATLAASVEVRRAAAAACGTHRCRKLTVGKQTSTIWMADIFSITARLVSPGAKTRSLCCKVTYRQ